jgi:hypothetical protein
MDPDETDAAPDPANTDLAVTLESANTMSQLQLQALADAQTDSDARQQVFIAAAFAQNFPNG